MELPGELKQSQPGLLPVESGKEMPGLIPDLIDPQIPALRTVLDPGQLSKHLCRVLPGDLGVVEEIQVLQHHPGSRCTMNVTLQGTREKTELICKVYATDRSDVYRTMEEIIRAGFGPGSEFSIPQPLAYLADLHLLVQEKVKGALVTEIFEKTDEHERAKAAERCARWLANFHARGPRLGPALAPTKALLTSWQHHLGRNNGPLADKARSLLQRLTVVAAVFDGAEMCACHGGFCHRQLVLADTRTVTFDWDSYCLAEPASDVAKFIFKVQQLAIRLSESRQALDDVIEVFCKTYASSSSFDVFKKLPFYKALHCFKSAKRHLKWGLIEPERTETLLDDGLRVLAEEM
jgi:phosphotransferase family enzyme